MTLAGSVSGCSPVWRWPAAAIPVAGARRTESAYERFRGSHDVATLVVDGGDERGVLADAVSHFSGVVASGWRLAIPALLGPPTSPRTPPSGASIELSDHRLGVEVDRHVVLEGRLADPARLEVMVTHSWANRLGTNVGDHIDLTLPSAEILGHASFDELRDRLATDPTASRTTTALVTGIVLPASEVAPDDQDRATTLFASPAVGSALGMERVTVGLFHLLLASDDDTEVVRRQLESLVGDWASSDTPIELISVQDSSADQRTGHTGDLPVPHGPVGACCHGSADRNSRRRTRRAASGRQ